MIARSIAPARIAASSPLTPIHSTGIAIAARIEAMKMKDRREVSHGHRSIAHGTCSTNASVSTSDARAAAISPRRSGMLCMRGS